MILGRLSTSTLLRIIALLESLKSGITDMNMCCVAISQIAPLIIYVDYFSYYSLDASISGERRI